MTSWYFIKFCHHCLLLLLYIAGTISKELGKLNRLPTINLSGNRLKGEQSLDSVCAGGFPIGSTLFLDSDVFDQPNPLILLSDGGPFLVYAFSQLTPAVQRARCLLRVGLFVRVPVFGRVLICSLLTISSKDWIGNSIIKTSLSYSRRLTILRRELVGPGVAATFKVVFFETAGTHTLRNDVYGKLYCRRIVSTGRLPLGVLPQMRR